MWKYYENIVTVFLNFNFLFFILCFPYFIFIISIFPSFFSPLFFSSTHVPLLFFLYFLLSSFSLPLPPHTCPYLFSLFPSFDFFPTTSHFRTFRTELGSFFLFLFLFSFFLSPFSLTTSSTSFFPSIPSKYANFLGVLLIKTLPSKCISQIRLDINKILKKYIQRNAHWRRRRKKKKRMAWEWALGQSREMRWEEWGIWAWELRTSSNLLKGNLLIAFLSPTYINQRAQAFSKMHIWAPLWHCALSSQTQNATFSKKLHFIPNQIGFLYLLSSKRVFWIGKVETNRHNI